MYLSTNSRYVLHRAHLLTPSAYFIKGAEKLLSVKIPNDDPTKPPLRVNIPQEPESRPKLIKSSGFTEPRSKSLVSRPTAPLLNPGFKENPLSKSESESQLPQLKPEKFLMETPVGNEVSSVTIESYVAENISKAAPQEDNGVAVKSEDDYHEGLSTPLNDPATGEALANSYVNTTALSETDKANAEAKSEVAMNAQSEVCDPKMLYIIVDSAEESGEKLQYKSVADSCKEGGKTPPSLLQDDFATFKTASQKIPITKAFKSKTSWQKPESSSSKKSKSASKISPRKPDARQSSRFEVQEVEDPATYVFHSRPNKDLSKSFGVERVPEKSFSTRTGSPECSEPQIKVHGSSGKGFKGFQNEVTPVEELPNFVKVREGKKLKASKASRSEGWGQKADKSRTLSTSKSVSRSPTFDKNKASRAAFSEPSQEPDFSSYQPVPEYLGRPVDVAAETDQTHSEFVKDDFGTVRSVNRSAEFRMPGQAQQDESTAEKPSSMSSGAEPQEETPVNYSSPVAEPKPEYNLTKVESVPIQEAQEAPVNEETVSRCKYCSREKSNSVDYQNSTEVQSSDSVPPNPVPPPQTHHQRSTGQKNKRNTKKRGKYADAEGLPKKVEPQNPTFSEKNDSETDFKTSGSFVSIGCDKVPCLPMKFSAAFPPLLCEALKIRGKILGFRREFLFSDKLTGKFDFGQRPMDMSQKSSTSKVDLSENSILFPKAESEKFDCSSLFGGKDGVTSSGLSKNSESEKSPKISDNIANVANEGLTKSKGQPSVDSLAMMKRVKEIVELDLENAIKIFKKVEPHEETSSVVMLEGDKWRVDTEALEMCVKMRKDAFDDVGKTAQNGDVFGDLQNDKKIEDVPQQVPKYLPSRRQGDYDMKLSDSANSVVMFNPLTNEFFLNKEALATAIRQRAAESFDNVIIQTLEGQLTKGKGNESIVMFDAREDKACVMKSGDSILVFDEETQSWKVDFSILEKREEQLRMEEELTRRSELILETFEQLEKGHISKIPLPSSKDKKIFDYKKEEWKNYPTEKVSKEKPTKSKLPFKESNAEEIRRNNSDLYENLFVGKKEDPSTNQNDSNQSNNDSKSCSSYHEKNASGSGSGKDTGKSKGPDDEMKMSSTGPGESKPCESSKEDNFWGSFLDMNILPRDISEITKIKSPPSPLPPPPPPPQPAPPKIQPPQPTPPKIQPPSPQPSPPMSQPPSPPQPTPPSTQPPPPKPPSTTPSQTPKKDPKPSIPIGKIDDPKPIIRGKRIEESRFKIQLPVIGDRRIEDFKVKLPFKEAPKSDPKKKPSDPPVSTTKPDTTIKAPAKEKPKVEDATKKPSEPAVGVKKEEEKVKAPAKEAPKVESPPKKPADTPPSLGSAVKKEAEIKTPTKDLPKAEDPKKKPPEVPPSATGDSKTISSSKPPNSTRPSIDDPRSGKSTPTIGAPASPFGKIQDPKSSASAKKDHYVSENIVEISRNTIKESPPKYKQNKIETVKLNITSEKRLPSKVMEINLNKKCEEKGKESNPALRKQTPENPKKPLEQLPRKTEKCSVENKTFYKNFEKYKTPFSDPEYEEKSMKIKSDIESNPNLKKLDTWNKTLVLHDVGKPPENIETWLKDETDKMATLLLKVLQEAADGKPRKKQPLIKSKPGERVPGKSNPFDGTPKKCESTPESFLFKIRTVNLSLENEKSKSAEDRKPSQKQKDSSGQQEKTTKPYKVIESTKLFSPKEVPLSTSSTTLQKQRPSSCMEVQKSKMSHTALEPASTSKDVYYQNILPLEITEEVPGPEFLKKLSNAWKLFPIIGSQMTIFTLLRAFQLVNLGGSFFGSSNPERTRTDAFTKLFNKYGPIVNVQGPLSGNVVLIHKPEHFNAVFEQDCLMTVRSVFDSLDHCRRETEDKIISVAISTDWSKPEWNELKRGSADPLLKSCEKFFEPAEFASDSLLSSLRKTKNMQHFVSEDFMEEIKRWSLEGMCSVMFEKSFGFLDRKDSSRHWILEPDRLYTAVEEATNCLNKCETGFQTWRVMSTPSSVGLGQAYRTLSNLLSKQLYQADLNLKYKNEIIKERNLFMMEDLTFLESMMLNDGMTADELTCNLVDILLLGTNMMNSALGFLLYDLAQNVKAQNKLLQELQTVLPNKSSRLSYQNIQSLNYLQACLKESLRLHVPVPIFYRMLQNDILLSNYIIPKGTYVVMDYKVTCMKEQIFDAPEKFMPERWINEEKWMTNIHPFDTFPMCHGPRAELAKRIVEMQLWTCLAKVVRNFKIEYHFGEIEGTNNLISVPNKPLKLNFIERDS